MLLSYNWLKKHIETDLSPNKMAVILTDIGLEVEGIRLIEKIKDSLENVLVGEILECEPHPNAANLKVTTIGFEQKKTIQIVCGAPNVKKGLRVAVATIGSFVLDKTNQVLEIKQTKIRDLESEGMLCSESELGIGTNSSGLLELDEKIKLGTKLKELYPEKEDYQLEIGLTPNRSDAMSHYGVARDLFAYIKSHKLNANFNKIDVSDFNNILEKELIPNPFKIEIADKTLCSRYAGLFIENIEIKESPFWLKEFLKNIGIEPKNNVVDITNFLLHDIGQPIHAFDADKIGRNIVIKKAENIPFVTLDQTLRKLTEEVLIVSDENNPIALAGIIGGLESSVTEKTKNIFLESAYFDPITIRKSAKSQGISTDASFRFERGVDPNMTLIAIKYAAILLHEYANAKISYSFIDQKIEEAKDFNVVLRYHKIDQILGQRIHREKIKEILALLEIKIISDQNEMLDLFVPPYRVDIKREVDLIEEILRIYGYNSIQAPDKLTSTIVLNKHKLKETIEKTTATSLVTLGFYEAMNNSLTKETTSTLLNLQKELDISIVNPLSKDLCAMRQSLLGGLLENISYNLNRQQKNIRLFEFGQVYHLNLEGAKIEETKLGLVMSGNKAAENWNNTSNQVSFYSLKGIIEQFFSRLNININEIACNQSFLSEGIDFVDENGIVVGFLGIVAPKILQEFSVQQEVFYAEINWAAIISIPSKPVKYKHLPKYPKSRRDLALLVDKSVSYKELHDLAFKSEENLLTAVNLFDVYEGKNLPENKKSYALSFYLQNTERTLKDSEIENVMTKILANFKKNLNAELR